MRRIAPATLAFGCSLLACKPAEPTTAPEPKTAAVDEPEPPEPDDLPALEALLQGEGLTGWMHASVPEHNVWVFTYRKPGNFFASLDMSVIPAGDGVVDALAELERHDKVKLKGALMKYGPQVHIRIDEIEVVEPFENGSDAPEYRYVTVPENLASPGEVITRVHAVGDQDDPLFVVEVRDLVMPVRLRDPSLLEGLYRGDIVKLNYVVGKSPHSPAHLEVDPDAPTPLEVLDAMVDGHGEPIERVGVLVRFPKSPQIIFDVYALQSEELHGITREYTLLNFEDEAVFEAVRDKLGKAWKAHAETAIDGRNKEINPRLQVRAKGIKNVIAPNQANPQILLASPDDVEVIVVDE